MEQFTKKAASALKLAAKAARRRGHSYIGSEHLLLGLLEEGEGNRSPGSDRSRGGGGEA